MRLDEDDPAAVALGLLTHDHRARRPRHGQGFSPRPAPDASVARTAADDPGKMTMAR